MVIQYAVTGSPVSTEISTIAESPNSSGLGSIIIRKFVQEWRDLHSQHTVVNCEGITANTSQAWLLGILCLILKNLYANWEVRNQDKHMVTKALEKQLSLHSLDKSPKNFMQFDTNYCPGIGIFHTIILMPILKWNYLHGDNAND